MEQLNPGDSLWEPYEPTTSGLSEQEERHGEDRNSLAGADGPICCWLLCPSVYTPKRPNPVRRRPADV